MTIPVPHLPGCYKTSRADPSRYACNCGADSQNELRAMLDRVEASAHSYRVGDASPETAEPCGEPDREDERADATRAAYEAALAEDPTMPRRAWRAATFAADVSREAMCAARRELVKDATAQHERARYRVAAEEVPGGALLDVAPPTDASLEARAALQRMTIILPHIQTAARDAAKATPGGRVLLAIIAKAADGSGRITCDFESGEFLADLESLVRAIDASRPTLTEEQAAAWAREMAETNEPGWEPNAAALLRASRGELGPTKPGAQ